MEDLPDFNFSRLSKTEGDGVSSHQLGGKSAGVLAAISVEYAIANAITPKEFIESYYGDADPETMSKCSDFLSRSLAICSLMEVVGYYSADGVRPEVSLPPNLSNEGAHFIDKLHELVVEKKGHVPGEVLGPRRLIGLPHPRIGGRDGPTGDRGPF